MPRFLPIALALCLGSGVGPKSSLMAEEIPETFSGVRPMGMGDAFTGLANDHNALWTNPAGISRVRKARSRPIFHLIQFPTALVGFNKQGKSFAEAFQQNKSAGQGLGKTLEAALAGVDASASEAIWGRGSAGLAAFFDAPRGSPWAIAVYTDTKGILLPDSSASGDTNQVLIDTVSDWGGVLSMAWTNRTNRFNIGLQIRPTLRYGYYDKLAVATLADRKALQERMTGESNSGTGIGMDMGVMWTFADFWFPTIGMAVRNLPSGCVKNYLNPFEEIRQTVCGTKFSGRVNNPESTSLVDPTDIRLGVSMTPRLTHKIALRFALDLHHLYYSPDNKTYFGLSGIEPLKQTHAGLELFIGNPLLINPLSLRVGYNQGYLTSGASLRFGILALEGAVYGRDIASGAKGQEDRRTLISLAIEVL